MTPADVLDVQPGDRVLDLCAAPGGKATALGAKLKGEGLLMANDISASRCRALLKNIEVFGISNAVITNEVPARLATHFPAFFDRILVDAPCSGEGMFRKDEAVAKAWYPEKNEECARIQKDIIVRAADMLREGGQLLYSTCTFSPEENEEVIAHLLRERPEMRLLPLPGYEGFAGGIAGSDEMIKKAGRSNPQEDGSGKDNAGLSAQKAALCVRIWPHRMQGEGHFLALLGKGENSGKSFGNIGKEKREAPGFRTDCGSANRSRGAAHKEKTEDFVRFLGEMGVPLENYTREKLYFRKDQLYLAALPEEMLKGITCIRNGLLLGEQRKDRFEPSQAMAMSLPAARLPVQHRADLSSADEAGARYLKGETLPMSVEPGSGKGWKLVTVDGYTLGWAKQAGNLLKNKYLAGWRMQ